MKKSKRIIALLSAITMLGTLNAVTLPDVVSAQENATMPEWVPQNYTEAMEFYNKHGKTYIKDGFICTVESRNTWSKGIFKTEDNGSTINYEDDIVYTNIFNEFIWPDEPIESDYETMEEYDVAYMEYRTALNKVGLSPTDREYHDELGYFTEPECTYAVTVYRPDEAGTMSLSWIELNSNNIAVSQTDLCFEIDKNGTITQTDCFGWLPDCIEEYNTFFDKNGTISVHNNYVVYCKDICYDGGLDVEFSQKGAGKIEEEASYSACRQVFLTPPGGTGGQTVKVYKPTVSGTVTGTWLYSQLWDPDCEFAEEDSAIFNIGKDLTVTMNKSNVPEWIPLNYMDTMRFYNQHGKTYIKDGYICTIMRKVNLSYEDYKYISSDEGSTADYSSDIIYSATFDEPVMPKKPEQSDYENYTEYEKAYNEYEFKLYEMGISPSAWDYLEVFQHGFDVVVYKPDTAGTLNLNWSVVRSDNGKTIQQYDLSFDISEDGTITETDMFAWVPDCMAEYEAFVSKNGKTAVYNNHIIYCDDSIYGYFCGYSGEGSIETVLDDNANMLRVDDAYLVGGGTYHVKVYKPTKAGDVTLQRVKSYEQPFVQYYSIDENLNISDKKNIGDCNSDGKQLSIADTVSMQKWLTQKELYYGCYERYNSDFSPKNADMNNDGKVNVFDCIIMKRLMLEKLTADSDGKVSVEFDDVYQRSAYDAANTTDCAFIVNSIDELQNKILETEGITLADEQISIITENMSDDNTIILMYTKPGSSSDRVSVNDIVNDNGKLTISASTLPNQYPTPDMTSKRIILLVDKNAVSDVTSITVSNTAMTLA